ncbi:MAG TPA: DUF885 domain-containing protein [Pirellulales bacterium]|nr:DUF885 domain-containing protein [Pirellulales bacterium]
MRLRYIPLVFLLWPLLGVLAAGEEAGSVRDGRRDETADVTQEFLQLLDDQWEHSLRKSPVWATRTGDRRYNDQLERQTPDDIRSNVRQQQEFLQRLERIDRAQLSRSDQMNYDILKLNLQNASSEHNFESYLMRITNRAGFHISFPELRLQVPLKTVEDYDNYIARLSQFRRYCHENIELMRLGIGKGMTTPSIVLAEYRKAIDAHIVDEPTKSLLYEPFKELPTSFDKQEARRLRADAAKAIRESVVPGYEDLLTFMRDEYMPACRETISASALPQGRDYYRYLVRKFTTLDLTPDEVHALGLSEVKRIKVEMESAIRDTGFDGDFDKFVEYLRTDPKFYAATKEDLLRQVAMSLKTMDGLLPQLFNRLPRMPYGIREVPAYVAPVATTAYYEPPAGDGTRAGFYFVNTYDLKSRPLFNLEALSLHEAVPGHHLQIALQQELTDVPKFRRFMSFTAFSEGWALYAERLGLEVGLYSDPYQNFGRLNFEMWRACRLVVDTGIHYLGWTRQQAIDFMTAHTAETAHNIRSEVDRYISWPGQALAYKIGELKIRELRKLAEEELGHRFDVRQFHDVVLGSGAIPLPVLEENVRVYLRETLASENKD